MHLYNNTICEFDMEKSFKKIPVNILLGGKLILCPEYIPHINYILPKTMLVKILNIKTIIKNCNLLLCVPNTS